MWAGRAAGERPSTEVALPRGSIRRATTTERRKNRGLCRDVTIKDCRPNEAGEGEEASHRTHVVPTGPEGFVETCADSGDIDGVWVAGGLDGVVEWNVDAPGDDDNRQVKHESGDEPRQHRRS